MGIFTDFNIIILVNGRFYKSFSYTTAKEAEEKFLEFKGQILDRLKGSDNIVEDSEEKLIWVESGDMAYECLMCKGVDLNLPNHIGTYLEKYLYKPFKAGNETLKTLDIKPFTG